MSLIENQIKCGQTKAVNFTTDQLNNFCRIMIQMYIQPTMKKYLLLLKDSLKPYKTKFINTWLQYVYNDKLDGVVNKYNNTYH